ETVVIVGVRHNGPGNNCRVRYSGFLTGIAGSLRWKGNHCSRQRKAEIRFKFLGLYPLFSKHKIPRAEGDFSPEQLDFLLKGTKLCLVLVLDFALSEALRKGKAPNLIQEALLDLTSKATISFE
ncbi:hypothetical protein HAX54_032358, partial [Datura stramonium]|nr:hypothetical protein [Datura stramonium]